MQEFRVFLHAVRLLTVLRTGPTEGVEADWLNRSAKYFPLVGGLVGAASATVFLFASEIWTGVLPVLLAVTASIAITGALHEDGLADTADGLGGGRTPEARLAIMKDSRLGTYGALAIGISLALRVAALAAVPTYVAAAALIAAHAWGRLGAVTVMAMFPYAGDRTTSKMAYASDRLGLANLGLAIVFALIALTPLLLLAPSAAITGVVVGAFAATWLARKAAKLVGGHTGDVLGAVEQVFETAFLVGIAAIAASRLT
jgi:adenosylcobinamide-GDP ribazoletransferase